jgi:hypothetical protein
MGANLNMTTVARLHRTTAVHHHRKTMAGRRHVTTASKEEDHHQVDLVVVDMDRLLHKATHMVVLGHPHKLLMDDHLQIGLRLQQQRLQEMGTIEMRCGQCSRL